MKKLVRWLGITLGTLVLGLALLVVIIVERPFQLHTVRGEAKSVSVIDRSVPSFPVEKNGDFRLMQLADTHLYNGSGATDAKTLDALRNVLEQEKPTLVAATGDVLDGINYYFYDNKAKALEAFAQMMEDLGQYWAYVPGNNDGEMSGSTQDVVAAFSKYPHCIVSNAKGLEHGATQYSIDVTDSSGKPVHSLVFLDSLARIHKNRFDLINTDYDYFREDQAEWLKTTLAAKKAMLGQGKVSVFFHMNTPAMVQAAQNGVAYSPEFETIPVSLHNDIPNNKVIDDVIQSAGTVGLVAIGHVHPQASWLSYYQNTYYHISKAAGYEITDDPSVVMITIHTGAGESKGMYDFREIKLEGLQ